MANEAVDENVGMLLRQMLGDLEALNQVEAALELQRLREVVGDEVADGDRELGKVDIMASTATTSLTPALSHSAAQAP